MKKSKHHTLRDTLFFGTLNQLKDVLTTGTMADVPYPDLGDNTPIHLAAYNKWPEKLKILLDSLKDDPERLQKALEAKNVHGISPLFEAVWVGKPPYAFKEEANPPSKTYVSFVAAFHERMKRMPETVQVLFDNGATVAGSQPGYPSGKEGQSYTIMGWIKKQLSNPTGEYSGKRDLHVERALKKAL